MQAENTLPSLDTPRNFLTILSYPSPSDISNATQMLLALFHTYGMEGHIAYRVVVQLVQWQDSEYARCEGTNDVQPDS